MAGITNILKDIPQLELDQSKKRILMLYILGIVILFAFYIFVFLSPALGNLFAIMPEVRLLRIEINAVEDDLLFEDKLKNRLAVLKEKLVDYENMLSREKELPLLFGNISKEARSSRVKILSMTPLSVREKDADSKSVYQEVPIEITAQSGYHEFGNFLYSLESSKRYLEISDLKIKGNMHNPRRHDINFILYAYTFKGDK